MLKFLNLINCSLVIFYFSGGEAHAYLDPGTGSIIITAIIAMLAAISIKISYFWHKFKSFFKNKEYKKNNKAKDK